jgi:glucosamine-phosphate N-acetyltransferase
MHHTRIRGQLQLQRIHPSTFYLCELISLDLLAFAFSRTCSPQSDLVSFNRPHLSALTMEVPAARALPVGLQQMQSVSPSHARATAVVAHLLGSPRSSPSPTLGYSPQPPDSAAASPSHAQRSILFAHSVAAGASAAQSVPLPYSTPTPVSAADPHLLIRRAQPSDFAKGHIPLLSQLTSVGNISAEAYTARLSAMQRCGDVFQLLVIEDTSRSVDGWTGSQPGGLIIASATLVVELKFVHGCGSAGHIEDVVVRDGYRGKNLGVRIVTALHEIGRALGCYKIMLDCKESNAPFYAKMGYRLDPVHMRLDLE